MDLSIAAILAQDGITTGAIYALLALALVLVFSVTRVIFIPQGEFVSYGALTLAALQTQKFPATCWLLMAMGPRASWSKWRGSYGTPSGGGMRLAHWLCWSASICCFRLRCMRSPKASSCIHCR